MIHSTVVWLSCALDVNCTHFPFNSAPMLKIIQQIIQRQSIQNWYLQKDIYQKKLSLLSTPFGLTFIQRSNPTPSPSLLPLWYIRVYLTCQFIFSGLYDITLNLSSLQYLSCQTRCQADFTSPSCCIWCWVRRAPPGDCLTLPPTFPLHHPSCRSRCFHTFLLPCNS